jgi:hypothetical protein
MAIRRRGLGFAAAFVLVSGFLRLSGPHGAPKPQSAEPQKKEAQSVKHATNSYPADVERTIWQFFAIEKRPDEIIDPEARWKLPSDKRKRVRFVIAILPDPVHTHLGLLFDRSIAAIQLAAQAQNYVFDRAILPWDRASHQDPDLEKRQKEIEEQRIRETYPGLMIFREGLGRKTSAQADEPGSLFVLVVGETPTGGVRSLQFKQALELIDNIRGTPRPPDEPLSILGPSSSGSLSSLNDILNREHIFNHTYSAGQQPMKFRFAGLGCANVKEHLKVNVKVRLEVSGKVHDSRRSSRTITTFSSDSSISFVPSVMTRTRSPYSPKTTPCTGPLQHGKRRRLD